MQNKNLLSACCLALCLAACGGGGGGDSGGTTSTTSTPTSTTVVPTDAQILSDIATSQSTTTDTPIWDTSAPYGSIGNPYKGNVDGQHSYRWNVERDGLIPVLDLTNEPETGTALTNLESAVGRTLFQRLPSSTNTAAVTRGIIINNAVPPQQGASENACGEVYANRSNFFGIWVGPDYSIDPTLSADWQSEVDSGPLVDPQTTFNVDVAFATTACAPMEPLVEHELIHALGLTGHFDGFGEGSGGNCNGALCTDRAYPVLKTLYGNAPMTSIATMKIVR